MFVCKDCTYTSDFMDFLTWCKIESELTLKLIIELYSLITEALRLDKVKCFSISTANSELMYYKYMVDFIKTDDNFSLTFMFSQLSKLII